MKKIVIGLGIIAILTIGFIFIGPYLTLYQIKSAAENQDGAALSEHIDFLALRQSLKDQMNVIVGKEMTKQADDNPFAALGAALGGMMIEKMVDMYVTPASITELMKGKTPEPGSINAPTEDSNNSPLANASTSYESFSKFSVTIKGDDSLGEDVKLVFRRRGMSWKLTEIVLPLSELGTLGGQGGETNKELLMDPAGDALNEQAPDEFSVRLETSDGPVVIQVTRDWAPIGADRFYNLVRNDFYDEQRFFRVVPGFVVQWGLSGNPELNMAWHRAHILDDPVKQSNTRGRITYANTNQPNTRTTQLFINLGDNANLDGMGFVPFGEVVEGMEVVDQINAEYGQQPSQGQIAGRGNAYLEENFPNLDYIAKAEIID